MPVLQAKPRLQRCVPERQAERAKAHEAGDRAVVEVARFGWSGDEKHRTCDSDATHSGKAANFFSQCRAGSKSGGDLVAVSAIVSFADLVANHLSSNLGGDAVITVGANTITLLNVVAGDLTANDFLF